jgi:hypothetical protein
VRRTRRTLLRRHCLLTVDPGHGYRLCPCDARVAPCPSMRNILGIADRTLNTGKKEIFA